MSDDSPEGKAFVSFERLEEFLNVQRFCLKLDLYENPSEEDDKKEFLFFKRLFDIASLLEFHPLTNEIDGLSIARRISRTVLSIGSLPRNHGHTCSELSTVARQIFCVQSTTRFSGQIRTIVDTLV